MHACQVINCTKIVEASVDQILFKILITVELPAAEEFVPRGSNYFR